MPLQKLMQKVKSFTDGGSSLKSRVLKGSFWTMGEHFFSRGLAFISNLILTRLLLPEDFGLIALGYTFLFAMEMFSDVGIYPNLVQSKRSDDPVFINTAWTVQVFRGLLMWLGTCLLAVPAAIFYREPVIAYLLPVLGLNLVLSGFNSTKIAIANRDLDVKAVAVMRMITEIVGLVFKIIAAWYLRSVWALVIGSLFGALTTLLFSHFVLKGQKNQFCWDRDSFNEIFSFGQWIFLSSILSFLVVQGNPLILGRLVSLELLGLYGLASSFATLVPFVVGSLYGAVLMPAYAEIVRERPQALYGVLKKSRGAILSITWLPCLFFVLFGNLLVQFLYPEQFSEAGWILQLMAAGILVREVGTSYGQVLISQGKARTMMLVQGINLASKIILIIIGYYFGGEVGTIVGLSVSNLLAYPFEAMIYSHFSLWQPEVDLPFMGAGLLVYGATLWFAVL